MKLNLLNFPDIGYELSLHASSQPSSSKPGKSLEDLVEPFANTAQRLQANMENHFQNIENQINQRTILV